MICRSCGTPTDNRILSLRNMPLVNRLLDSQYDTCSSHSLEVMYCDNCALGQLREIVPPMEMFSEYSFYSSVMAPIVDRAQGLVAKVIAEHHPKFVIEVGSNDGYLLNFYRQAGISILGVDVARGPANNAALKGVPTVQELFSLAVAKTLPKADILHANNVLDHCPNVHDVVAGFAEVLKDNGTVIVEVPYLGDLISGATFDTVYHEHIFYFSIKSLVTLFENHGLTINKIESLPQVLGGSIRVFASKGGVGCSWADTDLGRVSSLQSRTDVYAKELKDALVDLRSRGRSVWGFGAAAKATVFLNYAGIDQELIEAVADDTPAKQYKFIPGTGIPIRSTQDWLESQPKHTCIFTWNYAQYIAHKYAVSYKGNFFTSRMPGLIVL